MPTTLDSKRWKQRIETARRWRQNAWANSARTYVAMYQGAPASQPTELLVDMETVNVNLVYPYLKALVATVYAHDPTFLLEPQQESAEREVETLQMLLNYYWRELGLKEEVKRALLDAFLTGWGWMEYGYQAEFGVEGEPKSSAKQTMAGLAKKIVTGIASLVKGERDTDRQTAQGHVVEFNEYIKKESLFARRLSPFVMLVPWDVPAPRDWPWLGYELFFAREDAEHLPGITADQAAALKPITALGRTTGAQIAGAEGLNLQGTTMSGEPPTDQVRLIKIWDKRSESRILFGDGVEEPLKVDPWPYDFEGFPIVPLIFNPVPETDQRAHVFPMSMLKPALPQLKEITKLFTNMAENRKRFHTKVLLDTQDDDLVKKISDANLGGAIKFPGIGANPNLVRELKIITNNAQLEQEYRILIQQVELILTLSLLNLGSSAPGIDTATEATIINQGVLAKIRELQDVTEMFAVEGARRILGMRNFITQPLVLKITGDSSRAGEWIKETPADIKGEYKVHVMAGSTLMPQEAAVHRKQLLDFSNIANLYVQQGQTSIDIDYLLKLIARTFPEIKDIERLFSTGMDEERATAQQENQLLMQNMPQVVSPKDNHALHVDMHGPLAKNPDDMTGAVAQHIADHSKFLQNKIVGKSPTAMGQAADPTLTRGMTKFPDVLQGLRNQGQGTGAETNQHRGLGGI